ncbi:MAG: hypothetical protein QOI57_2378 [Rubrobacteraceae bacterium]|jgi:hypothetical protein|nr:hypothetical protein [Rubrobacteraceae bacterium]
MDNQQAKKINEAAQKFAEALMGSYRAVTDPAVSVQALNAELTQGFFDAVIENLHAQGESSLALTQGLIEQQQRQREALQLLAQESVNAHMDFLDSMFFYHRQSVEASERSTREG